MKKILIIFSVLLITIISFAENKIGEKTYIDEKKFVLVEGGEFEMGIPNNDWNSLHRVKLTYDFYVGRYEVTQGEVDGIFMDNRSKDCSAVAKNLPYDCVSWEEIIEFCNKLSKAEGIPVAYDKEGNLINEKGKKEGDVSKVKGYRLLTEGEWEYCAKGGKNSKGYIYSGSNNLNDVGWYSDNSDDTIHKVGTKKANELGIYDMSGNVSEVCQDFDEQYSRKLEINPLQTEKNDRKIVRGGRYNEESNSCKVTERDLIKYKIGTGAGLGFRICKTK